MTKDDAIAKIKKLLKTNGRTASEADTYQRLAAALADRYEIDLTGLDREEQERAMTVTEVTVGTWVSVPIEASLAAAICRVYFDVLTVEVQFWSDMDDLLNKIQFIGLDYQCVIAQHVFDFLVAEFRRSWNRRASRTKRRSPFMQGLYLGLRNKLHRARYAVFQPPAESAMVVSSRAKAQRYLADNYPTLKTTPLAPFKSLGAAGQAGVRAGRNIEIRPAVPGGRPAAALIGA